MAAKSALFWEGIDLETSNPFLNKLINKMSSALKRSSKSKAKENKRVFTYNEIFATLNSYYEKKWEENEFQTWQPLAMVLIALGTGCRISDIVRIKTKDIKCREKYVEIQVPNFKTSSAWEKSLPKEEYRTRIIRFEQTKNRFSIVRWLKKFMKKFGRSRKFLFATKQESDAKMNLIQARNALAEVHESFGNNPHKFRHTHASVAAGAGIPRRIFRERVGWKGKNIDKNYIHLIDWPLKYAGNYEKVLGL